MSNLSLWNAFDRDSFHDFLRLFDHSGRTDSWSPTSDVQETAEHYEVSVDIPGVDPKDVSINMEGDVLTISGERKDESKEKKGWSERSWGKFSRAFRLPQDIDAQKVEASFKNGVLRVLLPRSEQSRPRKIEIAVN